MTEVERIIKSGIINEDFLRQEYICDFCVDNKRKKIWAVELDLLNKFDEICKKYNLKYFLGYGSLLGAIRHKGFIPWDDDLDVCMPRDDFEKLIKIGSEEFQAPYFFQTPETDLGSAFSMVRLRNSNTTALITAFQNETFNQGIVFDIFPLDECIPDDEKFFSDIKQLVMNGSAYMRRNNLRMTDHDMEILKAANISIDPIENWRKLHALCSSYNGKNTGYISTLCVTTYPRNRELFSTEDFKETILVPFENTAVPIPAQYDKILRTTYGDYMQFPSEDDRGNWHTRTTFYDPDKSYKHYLLSEQNQQKG